MPNPILLGILGASAANAAAAYLLRETLNSTIMRIMIINGYNCPYLTTRIEEMAKSAASKGTKISAEHSKEEPMVMNGLYGDENYSISGILSEFHKNPQMDAYIVACFEDTGVDELRSVTTTPVIGLGEASFQMASVIARRFSVIATFPRSVPKIQQNLASYGVGTKCIKVRAAENNGINDDRLKEAVSKEIYRSIKEDQVEAIVIGGIPTTSLIKSLAEEYEIPILDGVTCAVKMAEAMISLRQKSTPIISTKNTANPSTSKSLESTIKTFNSLPSMSKIFGGYKEESKNKSETKKPGVKVSISSLRETEVVSNWQGVSNSVNETIFSDTSMLAEKSFDFEDYEGGYPTLPKWFIVLALTTYVIISGSIFYIARQYWKNSRLKKTPLSSGLIGASLNLPHNTDAVALVLKCHEINQENGHLKLYDKKIWIQPNDGAIEDCKQDWAEARILGNQNGDHCRVIIKGFSCKKAVV